MKIRKMLGYISRILSPGFGWCRRCGISWKFVDGHSTMYTESSGCFPLCKRCWVELDTAVNRFPYYKELYKDWEKYGDPGITWHEICTALLREEK